VAIGEADFRVLDFLAEHRVAVDSQVQALLGCAPGTAQRRLRSLAEAGLVEREWIFAGHPAACRITARGLGLLERRLPTPSRDLRGYRHDIGIAWLWLAAQNGAFGRLDGIVSEREMRSADRRSMGPEVAAPGPASREYRAGERYGIGVAVAGPRGGLSLHYPDLLLNTATGHRVAIELELTAKGPRRLDRIMLGYAADARVDAVLYLCPTRAMGLHVQAAARRAAISDRVQVQLLSPGSPAGAPGPVRGRGRRSVPRAVRRPTRASRAHAPVAEP
jgi:hypothetical protein